MSTHLRAVKKVIGADELGAIADIIRGYEIRDDVLQDEVKKSGLLNISCALQNCCMENLTRIWVF